MYCETPCKIFLMIAIVIMIAVASGCNSTGKLEHPDGRVEKIPQDVGVARAVADGIEKCKGVATTGFIPTPANDCKIATGVTDRAECFRSNKDIATMNTLGLALQGKDAPPTCAESAAKVGTAYMEKEAVQAKQLGSGGKFVAGALVTYGVTKEVVSGFVAGSAVGDTNVGELNVNGSGGGGGSGGEGGPGGNGGGNEQNVQVGNGTMNTAKEGGNVNNGEKPINGDGNTYNDSDSPQTSILDF